MGLLAETRTALGSRHPVTREIEADLDTVDQTLNAEQ